jgi:hypothetical protein
MASLFATVGADGDPFDRLVRWIDRWLAVHGECVDAYLEIGASCPPGWFLWTEHLDPDERELAVRAADVVVCDGSPASMTLCSSVGDAYDERQVLHCRQLAGSGRICVAEQEDRFASLLTVAFDAPSGPSNSSLLRRRSDRRRSPERHPV